MPQPEGPVPQKEGPRDTVRRTVCHYSKDQEQKSEGGPRPPYQGGLRLWSEVDHVTSPSTDSFLRLERGPKPSRSVPRSKKGGPRPPSKAYRVPTKTDHLPGPKGDPVPTFQGGSPPPNRGGTTPYGPRPMGRNRTALRTESPGPKANAEQTESGPRTRPESGSRSPGRVWTTPYPPEGGPRSPVQKGPSLLVRKSDRDHGNGKGHVHGK